MHRLLIALATLIALGFPAIAQNTEADVLQRQADREATGGAQTLEDIMRRQRGEAVDDTPWRTDDGRGRAGTNPSDQLGIRGGASDPELWRALRFGTADTRSSDRNPNSAILVQDGGMRWLQFRNGPLIEYGSWLLGGTVALLALFFLLRGRIRIDGEKTGRTVTRFKAIERFAHWLMAGSFIVLAISGLLVLLGRKFIIPYLGPEIYAPLALGSKWIHNNISWAFMLGLAMAFIFWVWHNLPSRTDFKWILQGGGLFTKHHPPAKKFNFGQKIVFWSVMLLGTSISVSGLSMLFPFEMPMFAKTFYWINATGIVEWMGLGALPETLSPQQEMQFAQLWHAIVGFVLMAIILAHIYIGSLGMEGAYDAMGSGEVEEQWAREHHSIWLEEVKAKESATPDPVQGSAPAE